MRTRQGDGIASFYLTFIARPTRGQRAPLSRRAGQFATHRVKPRRCPLMARSRMHRFLKLHNVIALYARPRTGFLARRRLFRKRPRGRAGDHPRSMKMTFRTAADSGRERARVQRARSREKKRENAASERTKSAAAAATPMHRRVREYYALSPRVGRSV